MSLATVETFIRHYLIAALWSSNVGEDDNCVPEGGFSLDDIDPATFGTAAHDCVAFIAEAGPLIEQAFEFYRESGRTGHPDAGSAEACAGFDFWLTRCGHGVGFWDRGMPGDLGDKLTALCGYGTNFPPVDLYVGDDGKIRQG